MLKTAIPFIDLQGKTPVDLLRAYPDKAQTLVRAARGTWGPLSQVASRLVLPLADKRSHAWLKRNKNPYLHEIETFADILGVRGIYALNLAYEWACSSGAYRTDGGVSLLRVLDWPFPALGKHIVIARQYGQGGEFYNVTWPGVSGVFTAMAPGRFCAALNQAPMRGHGKGFVGDWLINRQLAERQTTLPAEHLLRLVCEQVPDYATARRLLAETPISVPAIYILSGLRSGEGCVIERTEHDADIHDLGGEQRVATTNHFTGKLNQSTYPWRARPIDSEGRLGQSNGIHGHDVETPHFNWLRSPIVNPYTRLAVAADAAAGRLMVQGFEGTTQVTSLFHMSGQPYQEREVM